MSATNRGAKRPAGDFYGTPAWAVDAILPHLPLGGLVIDTGAGEGQIAARLVAAGVDVQRILAAEVDTTRRALCRFNVPGIRTLSGDFTKREDIAPADLAIGNPPYDVAETGVTAFAFVERAYRLVAPRRGTVAMLLRLNWLEGAREREPARLAFLRAHPPDVYVLPRRPSFGLNAEGKRATDATAYGWCVWAPGRVGTVRWLETEGR